MDLTLLTTSIRFPGAAGALQATGATAALIRELGDNYGQYHDFLASELEAMGGRPDPNAYRDLVTYYRDTDRWAGIVIAETLLRRCRAVRRDGRRMDDIASDEPTTLDSRHRLVSVESGKATSEPLPSGDANPHYWERPPSPPEQ